MKKWRPLEPVTITFQCSCFGDVTELPEALEKTETPFHVDRGGNYLVRGTVSLGTVADSMARALVHPWRGEVVNIKPDVHSGTFEVMVHARTPGARE